MDCFEAVQRSEDSTKSMGWRTAFIAVKRLSTEWLSDGDYSKTPFGFRVEQLAENQLIMCRGFAEGTFLFIR